MAFFRGNIFPNLIPLLFQAKKMSVTGTKVHSPSYPSRIQIMTTFLGSNQTKKKYVTAVPKRKIALFFSCDLCIREPADLLPI